MLNKENISILHSSSPPTQLDLLIDLFSIIATYEKEILIQKNKLLQNFCFSSPKGYFNFLITTNQRYLDFPDLYSFLSSYSYEFSPYHVKQIIKFYDKDHDHSWNFNEYLTFIQLNKNNHNFIYNSHFIKAKENDDSIYKYREELFNLFKLHIEMLSVIGKQIKDIKMNYEDGLDVNALFNEIKGNNNNKNIDVYNLFIFLNWNIRNITLDEIELIVYKFGENGEITLEQFEDLFTFDKFAKEDKTKCFKINTEYNKNKKYYSEHTKKCFNRFDDAYIDISDKI